jgi:hypothetical protein
MLQVPDYLTDYYKNIKPQTGYIYYFLDENLKKVPRDTLKIGVGFYRSNWIDGSFMFESDSYLLKALKEFLAARYLRDGNFPVWAEWTDYHARVWAAVGISRLMGTGSFYLRGHGPTIILRKKLDEIPGTVEIGIVEIEGQDPPDTNEGYLVYRDPGGGAHLRNWKLFYVVLAEILSKAGLYEIDDEFIQEMASGDPESRFVIKREEEIYGFPSLFKVWEMSEDEAAKLETETVPPLDTWVKNEAQFDGGGFTEEFKAYYKFMMDQYSGDDEFPDVLGIIAHGVSWLLASIPEELRKGHCDRYYELVDRYSPNEETTKITRAWLDKVTNMCTMK